MLTDGRTDERTNRRTYERTETCTPMSSCKSMLDNKTETLVPKGDMTYVREVTKLTCIVVCVYISSLTQFAYFLSLFELVNLLSKPFNAFKA